MFKKEETTLDQSVLEWKEESTYDGPFTNSEKPGYEPIGVESLIQFEEGDVFDVPPIARATEISGPLYTIDIDGVFNPHIIDYISGGLTTDAWDWKSYEVDLTSPVTSTSPISVAAKLEGILTKDKRGCVVWNLLETEQNYVNQLNTLETFFKRRMQEKKLIPAISINTMFFGVAELLELHTRFYKLLEKLLQTWDSNETKVGGLFLEYVDEFNKCYSRFIDNYFFSLNTYKKSEKENPEFVQFIKETSRMPETNRSTLKDYFIFPVQRTTRYHLLLKDLLKLTNDSHPDLAALKTAWEAMNDLATTVNDKKRSEEQATGLFSAYEQTKHCPPTLISNRRRLIATYDALCPKSNRNLRLSLCSDLLMISISIQKTVLAFGKSDTEFTHRFIRWLDLLDIDVEDQGSCTVKLVLNSGKNPSGRISFTTPPSDIPKAAQELAQSAILVQFNGYEGAKNHANFLLTIGTVIKSCIDGMSSQR